MLQCGLAWKRNGLSQFISFSLSLSLSPSPSLPLLSGYVTRSFIHHTHVYVHSSQDNRCSRGLWFETLSILSNPTLTIPSLDECEHQVLDRHMSSVCVYFWTDHTVGKAWNEWKDEWNRSLLTDQVRPEGCPKNEGWWSGCGATCDSIYIVKW